MNYILQSKYFKAAALGTGLVLAGVVLAGCSAIPGGPSPTPGTTGATIKSDQELTQEQKNLDNVNVDSLDQNINAVSTDANSI